MNPPLEPPLGDPASTARQPHHRASPPSKDLAAFGRAVARRWKILATSGIVPVGLIIAQAVNIRIPSFVVAVAILLLIVEAAFLTWRDERRETERLSSELAARNAELAELRAEPEPLVMAVTDDEYWLLTMVARYGLRREIHGDRRGASANSLWLDAKPIDYSDSRWFYDLVMGVISRGNLVVPPGQYPTQVHRLAPEGERVLAAGRRVRRQIVPPAAPLVNAITGHVETMFAI